MDAPNLFGASNRSAPADRSPRPREAEGRLAPEMAESHEARSQAQAQRRAWPQCIATWAASGVAVPPAFFGTFFRAERKYCPSRGGSPSVRARVGASIPAKKFPYSIAIVYSGLQMTFRVANNRQIRKRRSPASFPKIYRFELLLLNWAIIRNFFSLALI